MVMHEHHTIHELDPEVTAGIHHLFSDCSIRCNWLLAKHMFSCSSSLNYHVATLPSWNWNVNRIDLRICEQLLITSKGTFEIVLLGEGHRAIKITTRNGNWICMLREVHRSNHFARDRGSADHTPAAY